MIPREHNRMFIIKLKENGENEKKQNIKMYNHFRKQFGSFLKS